MIASEHDPRFVRRVEGAISHPSNNAFRILTGMLTSGTRAMASSGFDSRHNLRQHLLAWSVVGMACGWFGMPSASATAVVAFGLSGGIVGLVMGFATYPLSRQTVLVLVGAAAGAVLGCLGAWWSPGGSGNHLPGLCLMMGSTIGATAAIWQTPLHLLQRSRKARA